MLLNFTKMHGCGNDYIYVNGFLQDIQNPSEVAVKLSKRHFSIGADGLIMLCPSEVADAKMRMFNADGSEGKMCGNGVRCVAKFAYDNGICKKNPLKIETLSGIKTVNLITENEKVVGASVKMGAPCFEPCKIPVVTDDGVPVIGKSVTVGGAEENITCVSMGNPHCVIFKESDFSLWDFNIETVGKKIENDKMFPEKVNVEFVKKTAENVFEMRVWERGSGETYACGTGACAVVAASCARGFCKKGDDVIVRLKGGELLINYDGDEITMTGEAVTAYSGSVEI